MKKFLKVMTILILSLSFGLSAAFVTVYYLSAAGAEVNSALLPDDTSELVFTDENGDSLDGSGGGSISPDEITDSLKYAFVSVEDKRFYKHKGVDYIRIAGAAVSNLKSKSYAQGASTITQQLIKNTHLTQEKTLTRKLREIKLARQLEKQYKKDEILSMYLNVVYFGNGIYGVKNAAKSYFDKEVGSLTLSECATLAGVLKNPAKYSPLKDMNAAVSRRDTVLNLMCSQGHITEQQRDDAKGQQITLASGAETCISQSYMQSALTEAAEKLNISKQKLLSGGYTIQTYYNFASQSALKDIISAAELYAENEFGNIGDGGALLIDNESLGITAYFCTFKNDAYELRRPTGSAIKPLLVYAPALEYGLISAATPVLDEKTDFNGYAPSNYNENYLGWTDVRTALKKSSNVAAVKIFNAVGAQKVRSFSQTIGFKLNDADYNMPLALGAMTYGTTFLEVGGGYAMLANGGSYSPPAFIKAIYNASGEKVYAHTAVKTRVMSAENAYILTDILMDTVKDGTARGLNGLDFEVASKTGTAGVNEYNTDAYNVSYTTRHTLTVWHGNAKGGRENNLPKNETGGAYVTIGAKALLEHFYKQDKPADFDVPEGIELLEIDTYSQLQNQKLALATENTPEQYRRTELFSQQQKPIEFSNTFDNFSVENLETYVENGTVKISFDATDFFSYDIIRICGEEHKTLTTVTEKSQKIEYTDFYPPVGEYVEYYIKPYFYNQSGQKVEGNEQKTAKFIIKLDDSFDGYFE